ncbi:unnamed protein product [Effrenium voratum]|nr:unnamed protein product [Effrenium voratum]
MEGSLLVLVPGIFHGPMVLELSSDSECEILERPRRRAKPGAPSLEAVRSHVYVPEAAVPLPPVTVVVPKAKAPAKLAGEGRKPSLKELQKTNDLPVATAAPAAALVAQGPGGAASAAPDARPAQVLEEAGLAAEVAGRILAAAQRWAQLEKGGGGAAKRLRSVVFNLRQNAELVTQVNSGALSVSSLLRMGSEELAAPEVRKRRRQLQQQALQEVVLRDENTFAVRCRSCGEEARGVMARSAAAAEEEGWGQMSVRGSCPKCGHVWMDHG